MALAPLNLTPELHSWHLAGLSCLLLDEAALERLQQSLRAPAVPSVRPSGQYGQSGQPGQSDKSGQRSPRPVAQPDATVSKPVVQPGSMASKPASATANQILPGAASEPLLITNWPPVWRDLLGRMQPAPLAWSYPELGDDLLLSGNKQRSAALREMISRLRLPRGSSTFWPMRLPVQEALPHSPAAADSLAVEGATDYFLAGLDALKVRFLIVFGGDALQGTSYEALQPAPFSEQLVNGRLILTLPGFASLLATPGRLDKVVMFLEPILSRYLRP